MNVVPLRKTASLIEAVNENLASAKKHAEAAEHFYKEAGKKLKLLKEDKPEGVTWKNYVREEFDLSQERADELIRIADGKTTVKKTREKVQDRVTKHRKRVLRNTHSKKDKKDLNPKPADPETVWRRGLLFRCQEAVADATYEDWSKFTVTQQLIDAARKAAEAWEELAEYLTSLKE